MIEYYKPEEVDFLQLVGLPIKKKDKVKTKGQTLVNEINGVLQAKNGEFFIQSRSNTYVISVEELQLAYKGDSEKIFFVSTDKKTTIANFFLKIPIEERNYFTEVGLSRLIGMEMVFSHKRHKEYNIPRTSLEVKDGKFVLENTCFSGASGKWVEKVTSLPKDDYQRRCVHEYQAKTTHKLILSAEEIAQAYDMKTPRLKFVDPDGIVDYRLKPLEERYSTLKIREFLHGKIVMNKESENVYRISFASKEFGLRYMNLIQISTKLNEKPIMVELDEVIEYFTGLSKKYVYIS